MARTGETTPHPRRQVQGRERTAKGGRRAGSGRRQEWFKLSYNARSMLHTLHHWENLERAKSGTEPLTMETYLEALIGQYFGDELEDRVDRMKAAGRYWGNVFEQEGN
jgi:hypothetical protein